MFRQSFLSRDSILWWHFRSFKRKQRRMRAWRADPAMPHVVLLSTPAAVERWVTCLPGARRPGNAQRPSTKEVGEPLID